MVCEVDWHVGLIERIVPLIIAKYQFLIGMKRIVWHLHVKEWAKMFNDNVFLNINLMTNLRWFRNGSFDFINKHLLCINESRENYHKLGNLVIWWFCVHVDSSKLFAIPMISLWWMRLWMKSWTIHLFRIFATLKERKTKDMKGTKGYKLIGSHCSYTPSLRLIKALEKEK